MQSAIPHRKTQFSATILVNHIPRDPFPKTTTHLQVLLLVHCVFMHLYLAYAGYYIQHPVYYSVLDIQGCVYLIHRKEPCWYEEHGLAHFRTIILALLASITNIHRYLQTGIPTNPVVLGYLVKVYFDL